MEHANAFQESQMRMRLGRINIENIVETPRVEFSKLVISLGIRAMFALK